VNAAGRDERGRGSWPARAAGIAFLPLPLLPFLYGLAFVIDQSPPDPGCFEYCSLDRDLSRIPLVLGALGIWIAVLIWRRHVAAMALGLFVGALLTLLWAIGFGALVFAGGSSAPVGPWLLVVGLALLAIDGLLVAALREEMIRAGAEAAGSRAAESGESPPA
jgi:hypothetical protein